MNIDVIIKLAGLGILIAVITQLLKQTGRDDIAMICALLGLVIGLMTVVDVIGDLFDSVRRIFSLY
ncbi:MAG: stage III sporulation protein AC [Clostridia bacterium]